MKVSIHAKIGMDHYTTKITSGHHVLLADEPTINGGKDKGFSPHELLAASLAACTCITLRMVVHRKNWPIENIEVEVSFGKDTTMESTTFERKISFDGILNDEQKEKLLSVANKCPVHKTLSKTITINTLI
ncbi:MAG: OsmC family protein [Bacteroidota bacterium]|nr:OsmC family protein [Bacteroidota bacterium]